MIPARKVDWDVTGRATEHSGRAAGASVLILAERGLDQASPMEFLSHQIRYQGRRLERQKLCYGPDDFAERRFSTQAEFVAGLLAFASTITLRHSENNPWFNVLVIVCHGQPLSGTRFLLTNGSVIDLEQLTSDLGLQVPHTVAYVATCWGGYPRLIGALARHGFLQSGVYVAPVVEVAVKHAKGFMYDLFVAVFLASSWPAVQYRVRQLVEAWNEWCDSQYLGPMFRCVSQSGNVTEVGSARRGGTLSTTIEKRQRFRIVSSHRHQTAIGDAVCMSLIDPKGDWWLATPHPGLVRAFERHGDGAVVAMRYRIKNLPSCARPGFLEVGGRVVNKTHLRGLLPTWMADRVPQEGAPGPLRIPFHKGVLERFPACFACSWSALSQNNRGVDAFCFRWHCPIYP